MMRNKSGLGVHALVLLHLLLQTVKTLDSSENRTRAIDSWVKSIADLHRTQPAPTVHYSKYVPSVELIIAESMYAGIYKDFYLCSAKSVLEQL